MKLLSQATLAILTICLLVFFWPVGAGISEIQCRVGDNGAIFLLDISLETGAVAITTQRFTELGKETILSPRDIEQLERRIVYELRWRRLRFWKIPEVASQPEPLTVHFRNGRQVKTELSNVMFTQLKQQFHSELAALSVEWERALFDSIRTDESPPEHP